MKKALLLFWFLLPFVGFSQQIHSVAVQPVASGGGLEVIANMSLVHRPAFLHGSSMHLRNDTLFLKACYFEGIQATPVQFTDTFQVGNLASGQFTLHLTMIKTYNNLQCDSVASAVKTHAFVVNDITGIRPAATVSLPKISPNPATTRFRITGSSLQQINILDITGKRIFTQTLKGETSAEIDVAALPGGLYVVETVLQSGQLTRQRLVKN